MTSLAGRVALITGAAGGGIGRSTARAFGDAGAKVAVTARRLAAAQEVVDEIEAAGGTATAVALDTSDPQACEAAVAATAARFGGLDILVHNATHGDSPITRPIDEIDEDWWDPQLAVSLGGSFYLARAAFPHLKASGDGRLILFSSLRGLVGLDPNPAYAVAKAAVRGLARSLAREWGRYGITVNVISPAAMSNASAEYFAAYPERRAIIENITPLRRMGDARTDIAEAIVAVASPACRYLTGQTIALDGGIFSVT